MVKVNFTANISSTHALSLHKNSERRLLFNLMPQNRPDRVGGGGWHQLVTEPTFISPLMETHSTAKSKNGARASSAFV